jgi:hypothetical protein
MPRVGLRRKKVQTHVTEELSEEAKRNIPRSFVVKKGKIGNSLRDLMVDFRKVSDFIVYSADSIRMC